MNQLDDQSTRRPLISVRWMIAFICLFVNFSVFFVRNSFPVALLAIIEAENATSSEMSANSMAYEQRLLQLAGNNGKSNEWTATQQSVVLSSYFYGFILARLFVSRAMEITGQRKLVAIFLAFNAVLEILAPFSVLIHPYALAAVRSLIGFGYGAFPAAIGSLISVWAPRGELASLYTTSFSGASLGTITAYLSSGKMSEVYGWPVTFWVGSTLNFVSFPLWILIVRNQPKSHPWLSLHEKTLLDANKNIQSKKIVPWSKILKSPYVYINIFALFAATMLDSIFSIVGPSFLTNFGGLSITTTSYICGATYLAVMFFTLINGRISDYLINHEILTKIRTRKLFHFIGTFIAPCFLIALSFCEFNIVLLVSMFVLTGTLAKGTACSFPISVIDFAPNYVGTVQGLLAFGFLGSALTPTICSSLLQLKNGWDKTFYVASGINYLSCIIYCSFMTAEAQPWNYEA